MNDLLWWKDQFRAFSFLTKSHKTRTQKENRQFFHQSKIQSYLYKNTKFRPYKKTVFICFLFLISCKEQKVNPITVLTPQEVANQILLSETKEILYTLAADSMARRDTERGILLKLIRSSSFRTDRRLPRMILRERYQLTLV